MTDSLTYKPNVTEVLARLRSLYQRCASDRICAVMEVPCAALAEFQEQYTAGYCGDPQSAARIAFWDKLLGERASLEDDSIPSAYLSELDQGLYGGLLGGRVQFMAHPENGWISSMVAPLIDDWSQFESLRFNPSHPWWKRYLDQLAVFLKGANGKFGVSHFILIDSLNFVFELIGATNTYLSLHEHPEMVRRAIELAFDLNVRVQQAFFDTVPLLEGGTCSNMVQWVAGRVVSESVDPFHMTSVDDFERWGREPVQRMFDRFDGGVLHLHGNGRHLLPAVCTLKGLQAIFLGDDRGYPPAFDVLSDLRDRAGDVPLVVAVDYDGFVTGLRRHGLLGGVLYRVARVPSIDVANQCMEQVRSYRV
ncbi:MAG: hypothetical protein JXB62_14000 [Pirellulales bacterium]|nr:hypothetical protein [Pirellulales bacterium]